ncbi:septum formation initiator family protein [Lutibacter sp.]|uniref:FtsB family cell division protein n=1 Tax=Lutibacter sp. TaxID=1925666 RepID=UPI0035621329
MTFKQFTNKPLVKFITNKYVVILTVFIVWMLFFDENSYLTHREFNREIDKLNSEKEYYNTEINHDNDLIKKLKNKEELEKFAREEYKMKKDNEDIYIIEYDTLEEK